MPISIKYCIPCESYVNVIQSVHGEYHYEETGGGFYHPPEPPEMLYCDGPFVECEPPAYTEELWEEIIGAVPDADEMVRMDEDNEHIYSEFVR